MKESRDAIGAAGAHPNMAGLSSIIQSMLLLRKYMLMSMVGRVFALISAVFYVTGYYASSPFVMGFTFLILFGVGSLLSSTAQILIAIEITPTTRKSAKKKLKIKTKGSKSTAKVAPSTKKSTGGSNPSGALKTTLKTTTTDGAATTTALPGASSAVGLREDVGGEEEKKSEVMTPVHVLKKPN